MANLLKRALAAALCLALLASSWPGWALEERAALPVETKAAALPSIVLPSINAGLTIPSGIAQLPALAPAQAALAIAAPSAAAAAPKSAAPVAKEFAVLGRRDGPTLSQRVWAHARRLGFAVKPRQEEAPADAGAASPEALGPASPSTPSAPQAPPPPGPSRGERLSVLSGKVLGFFSTFLLIQLAVESLALTIPQMTDPLKNGFIALAGLSATSYVAYAIGSLLGGRMVQRFGLSRVYRAVLSARTLIWAGAALVFHAHAGTIPIAPLIGLFSVDYFVHSIGRVAEHTLQTEWFRDSPAASNRFGTMRDFVEYGTVFTTLGTGAVIAAFGFGAIIYAAPAMFGLAAVLATALRSLPQASSLKARAVPLLAGFKRLFRPEMRHLFLSRTLINNFVYLLYYVTGTAFGAYYAHGNTRLAAEAASALIGLLGMGANVAAFFNTAISRRIEKATERLPSGEQAKAQGRLMMESAARSLTWAAPALLGGWLFMSQAKIGSLIWPLFAVSPALILIGLTGQIAWTQLDTLLKDRMPKRTKAYVVGADRALTNLSYVANFLIWGVLFQFFGVHAFFFLGVYSTLTAAAYLWLARSMKKDAAGRK